MLTASDARAIKIVELSEEQERNYARAECLRLLGMDLDEFAGRWQAGEYRDNDDPKVTQVAMLLPDAG